MATRQGGLVRLLARASATSFIPSAKITGENYQNISQKNASGGGLRRRMQNNSAGLRRERNEECFAPMQCEYFNSPLDESIT